ncbi:MAG: cytochrome c oxidase subunit 2A [Candidatus Cohnella colombiensis]|uniref:Cytochrome c oxidase subunit 2A n=1 Tax=Candidatus Cohnella colombiensis TaxID=3121368 RepID=A0AA95JGF0_9BACL|nr:MAG: cytochrome c oxidase subunit 2A [Cohnella sp.]
MRDEPGAAKPEDKKPVNPEEHSLKGTFVSVMILGAFLIVSWLGVFMLFIDRQ